MREDQLKKIQELKKFYNAQAQNNQKQNIGIAEGITRAGVQGLGFGFGDELEATYKSRQNNTPYEEELQQSREKLEAFRESNPILAYGSEILGSIPSTVLGGAGLAKAGVTGAIKGGAVLGGAYGAGQGEDAEDRAKSAVIGGTLGGVLTGVSAKLFPKTTADAKKLLDKDIRLTHGQAFGGDKNIGGDFIRNLEESSTSIIGVGSPLSYAKINALNDFNRSIIKEALEPITGPLSTKQFNKLIPKTQKGTELYNTADNFVNDAYNSVLDEVNLDAEGIQDLVSSLARVIVQDKQISPKAKKEIVKTITKLIDSYNENGLITGRNFKNLQKDLKSLSDSYKKGTGAEVLFTRGIDNAKKEADAILLKYNPNSTLKQVDLSKAGMSVISRAVSMANKTEGIFGTRQFLNALKQNDTSLNKRMTAKGKGFLRESGELANRVLGSTMADSGSASRLVSGNVASDPSQVLRFLPASLASNILYGGVTRPISRAVAQTPRIATDRVIPSVSGLLSGPVEEQRMNLMNKGLLSRGN